MTEIDFETRFKHLDARVAAAWNEILTGSRLVRAITEGRVDRILYAMYMMETHHYTAHNARNQALVGVRLSDHAPYAKFCFEHAAEEVGHEKMALHDVMSMGLKEHPVEIPRPLPETEVLIAYLYWISLVGNPLQRLGYSYWAENAYQYITPLIERLREVLGLERSQLTFFIAHAEIDASHFEEIRSVMKRTCKSASDWDDVERVMETSLRLTGAMLDAVYAEYERYRSGQAGRYAFLEALDARPSADGREIPVYP